MSINGYSSYSVWWVPRVSLPLWAIICFLQKPKPVMEADYPIPLGIVHVRHERKPDGRIESAVNVPAGITYEIREQYTAE
ncbi:MAG: hypothetical protein IJ899_04945 [Blautia sp.]|nr:hypothetical protein [Blautia sp.]